MDNNKTAEFVNAMWDDSIIPEIAEYIKVPNKSPHFDPDWEKHGHMETAVKMLEAWCQTQPIKDMTMEIVRIEGRTPLLFIDIPYSPTTLFCSMATTTSSPNSVAGTRTSIPGPR